MNTHRIGCQSIRAPWAHTFTPRGNLEFPGQQLGCFLGVWKKPYDLEEKPRQTQGQHVKPHTNCFQMSGLTWVPWTLYQLLYYLTRMIDIH